MLRKDLINDAGENKAIQSFLHSYQVLGLTVGAMRKSMTEAGWAACWPDEIGKLPGQAVLTPPEAQVWLRYLFGLEQSLPVAAMAVESPVTDSASFTDDVTMAALNSSYEVGVAHGTARDGKKSTYENPAQSAAFMLGYNAAASGSTVAQMEEDRKLLEWLSHSVMTSTPEPELVEQPSPENSLKGDVPAPSALQAKVRNVIRAAYVVPRAA